VSERLSGAELLAARLNHDSLLL